MEHLLFVENLFAYSTMQIGNLLIKYYYSFLIHSYVLSKELTSQHVLNTHWFTSLCNQLATLDLLFDQPSIYPPINQQTGQPNLYWMPIHSYNEHVPYTWHCVDTREQSTNTMSTYYFLGVVQTLGKQRSRHAVLPSGSLESSKNINSWHFFSIYYICPALCWMIYIYYLIAVLGTMKKKAWRI